MRCRMVTLAASALLAACGGGGGGGDKTPSTPDAAAPPTSPPTSPGGREDAFVVAPDGSVPDAGPDAFVPPADARTPGSDGTADAAGDVGTPDADVPPGNAAGFAAGARPLRSPRYRLYAVVGPAAAVGAPLQSAQYHLETGPVLWLAPSEAPR